MWRQTQREPKDLAVLFEENEFENHFCAETKLYEPQ